MSTSAFSQDICELNNKQMAFLVTEIAMELMGCKYFDADGLPVSEFEDLVKYNRAGLREKNPSKPKLEQYLEKEIFYDAKGLRVYLESLNKEPPSLPPESRSMTQFGNRKIIIKPKTLVQKGVPIITVPVKTIPKKVTPILPKVVSVRQAVPMVSGSGGTHFRGPFSVISGAATSQQSRIQPRFEPPPIVSGGVGTQFGGLNRNEPAPAISGGGGTQFGGPSGLLTKAIPIEPPAPSVPKVSRILHRRNTLFHKGPY